MPAVNFRIRWPNGRETTGYSPSTVIFQYLEEGASYPLPEFLQRIEQALNNASERVKEVKPIIQADSDDAMRRMLQLPLIQQFEYMRLEEYTNFKNSE